MKLSLRRATYCLLSLLVLASLAGAAPEPVATKSGSLLGLASADGAVRAFRGIPFAAPPVGGLRWREPRPAPSWQGVRQATAFGPRCMQGPIFGDMVFRDQPSEDCLYLNVWTPAKAATERLPVMFW
ncbi:MAG: carboxylesterase family protein, partial [Burkholderiales bacterium]